MQYVAVTKDLDDEKQAGTLNFYRFNFTLDNLGTILLNAGIHNPDLMRLPQGFIDNPEGFADIEIPAPPKVEELEKLYHSRVAELGAKANPTIPPDVLKTALKLVGLPEDTSLLNKKYGQKFGRDTLLMPMIPNAKSSRTRDLAYKMGVLPEEAVESLVTPEGKLKNPGVEWVRTYEDNILLAAQIYNEVVKAAYDMMLWTRPIETLRLAKSLSNAAAASTTHADKAKTKTKPKASKEKPAPRNQ